LVLKRAADLLWFYFGDWALFTLLDKNGWSYERAERWLGDETCRALLRGCLEAFTMCVATREGW